MLFCLTYVYRYFFFLFSHSDSDAFIHTRDFLERHQCYFYEFSARGFPLATSMNETQTLHVFIALNNGQSILFWLKNKFSQNNF